MGYRLNRLDEPVLIAVSKPLLTEFGIHHRLESYVAYQRRITYQSVKSMTIPVGIVDQKSVRRIPGHDGLHSEVETFDTEQDHRA